ncbi:MAG: hypothetical protein M3450_20125 [Actinomycetota bacterium]|nr:hypothetical protein [Actinomycetota bacterium]
MSIERLAVKYPADDDNLWLITAGPEREVQIGSHPGGRPPFLIEGDLPDQRHETSEVAKAVDCIVAWLGSPQVPALPSACSDDSRKIPRSGVTARAAP